MRILVALVLSLALAVPATADSMVRIEGRRFVNPDGTTLHIKGINLGNWLVPEGYMFKFKQAKSPLEIYGAFERLLGPERAQAFWVQFRDRYVARPDIDFIKSVGFNTIRIPMHYRLLMDDEGEIGGAGWALLDRALSWSRAAGLLVILDLHAAPGGQTGTNHDDGPGFPMTFYLPRKRQLTIKLWRAIARRYAGDPTILGYDILNEPIATWHDTATLNPRLDPFYKDVTAAIREEDPGRIVFIAGSQWSTSLEMLGPPWTDNLAYTYHAFWANPKRDAIQRHLNFAARYNVPLFLGESGEFNDEWNAGFRKLHEAHGIGWAFWSYKNMDTPSTVVSVKRPEGWDEIVAFIDGTRKDKPDAAVIDRAISQYLENILLANGVIRWSYLESLGLKSAP